MMGGLTAEKVPSWPRDQLRAAPPAALPSQEVLPWRQRGLAALQQLGLGMRA